MEQQFYLGIVEDRKNDPLKLGRVRVRVFGVHSESLDDVPTDSLPWAISLMPSTSASLSGIGETVGYVEGTLVFLFFQDGESKQQPVILGSAHGIPIGKSPFGSAGVYLTETFEDVTPIEPEIDVPTDGGTVDVSEEETCPPKGTKFYDQVQTYYGIGGDKVKLNRNSERTPEEAPKGYVRRFNPQDEVFYYTSEHVTPEGKYWYDEETIASGSLCGVQDFSTIKQSEITQTPRENYRGMYGDMRGAIFLDEMSQIEKDNYEEYLNKIRMVEVPDGIYLRYIQKVYDSAGNQVSDTRYYYFKSEHCIVKSVRGTITYFDFYYDEFTGNGSTPTFTPTLIKSALYDTPIDNYKGLSGEFKELVVLDSFLDIYSGNSQPPSGYHLRIGAYVETLNSGNGSTIQKYTPAYRYYLRTEHVDTNGKYWYDVYTTPEVSRSEQTPTQATTTTPTQTPKSSGVDISKAVAKYGEIVNSVYKTLIDFGIKNNEAAIAILSNIGKECKFVPKREDMTYKTLKQLRAIFPSKFSSMKDSEASTYLNNEAKLANFVYANSDGNGDVSSGDGYKYRGGGLIQLTKKSNYFSIGNSLSMDLVGQPGLTLDKAIAAKIVAQYFVNRYGGANRVSFSSVDAALTDVTKKVNPGGFANDYPKVVEESKLYINNGELVSAQEEEIGNPNDPNNDIKKDATPEQINSGLISKRSFSTNNLGFKDPSEKYPLGSLLKEPDTNRLTRRNINQTIVSKKRKNRRSAIPSTGKDSFQEPNSAYNAQYPYNKVFSTESGHVLEFDDTYGSERINLFHTSGTFIEIDANGNQINKIIGDNFSITESNGYIYIDGVARVTVGGDVKLKVGGNLDIDVGGDLNYTVKGSINTKVGKDVTTNIVGKDLLNVGGVSIYNYRSTCSYNSASSFSYTASTMNFGTSGQTSISSSKLNLNPGSVPKTPVIQAIIPAVNKSSSVVAYNLPESFVDSEIIQLDDAQEADVIEYRKKAIQSGLMTQKQVDDGEKIAKDDTVKKDTTVPTKQPAPLPESCVAFSDKTNIPETLQLSKSFTLGMVSTKAVVSHYKVQAQRGLKEHDIVCNLKKVAENCLDAIKVKYPNMFVTSGFRTGSGTSQHELGEAIDIQFTGASKADYFDIAVWIKNNVIFDKLLLEYKTTGSGLPWIHISYRTNPRKEIYTFMNNAKVSSDIRKLQ